MANKFKVGDMVRTTTDSNYHGGSYNNFSDHLKGYEFIIKEIHGGWHRSEIGKYDGVREEELELVEEPKNYYHYPRHITIPANFFRDIADGEIISYEPLQEYVNKKSIMTNIKTFVKNLALSADEKNLRKVGFKTDCGEYTQEAIDVVLQDLCKEKEANLIEIANGIVAEEKK